MSQPIVDLEDSDSDMSWASYNSENKKIMQALGTGMWILRIFFFSASNLPHFCGFPQFRALRTLIRERERNAEKNVYKITLTEPRREMRKI